MKKKLSVKVIMSLILSAVLFCMPIGAFMANSGNTVSVQAQDTDAEENESETETPSTGNEEESDSEQESSTVSGNDIPTPECTCKEKCSQYSVDKECEVCKEDYSLCEYVNPNVKITINTPTGWHNDTTKRTGESRTEWKLDRHHRGYVCGDFGKLHRLCACDRPEGQYL